MTVAERIFSIRGQMAMMGLDAVIIPTSDPHMSEYLADHWKFREWVSGFTGSAGTVVILADKAGLWTDSRYFIQAAKELEGSEIDLFKLGLPETPTYQEWIVQELPAGAVVGINGQTISIEEAGKLAKTLKKNDLRLDTKIDLQSVVWEGRPPMPEEEVFELDVKYAGMPRAEKIESVRTEMKKQDTTHYIVCALDEIAWLLNLRGNDVECNPVFYSFMVISMNNVNLFIDPHKITSAIGKKLTQDGVKIFLYEKFYDFVSTLPLLSTFLIDPQKVNSAVLTAIPSSAEVKKEMSIITKLKAVKNAVEIKGMKSCHIKDGVAMVKFLFWLDQNIGKTEINELTAADKLQSFRSEQEGYLGDSFQTISAYGENAALPHYTATESSFATLEPKGLYLVDSGGQYFEGTTDITRTVALGPVSDEEKKDFTLVLKGHIALASAKFPEGTHGSQLDILARHAMWSEGINYGHGTGHGVGHLLNVHEGPQSIRPQDNGISMEEGMITSNEPGLYKEGRHGIRTENLVLTIPYKNTEFGTFYAFETITKCPIDTNVLNIDMLTESERGWLNKYHEDVYNTLNGLLNEEENEWLKSKTKAV